MTCQPDHTSGPDRNTTRPPGSEAHSVILPAGEIRRESWGRGRPSRGPDCHLPLHPPTAWWLPTPTPRPSTAQLLCVDQLLLLGKEIGPIKSLTVK